MATVKFNLRDSRAKIKTSIILSFNYEGGRLRMATGEDINPKFWNNRAQRAKELMEAPDSVNINSRLTDLHSTVLEVHKNFLNDGVIPDIDELKLSITNAIKNPKLIKKKRSFWDYFDEFIEFKRDQLGDIRDYENSLRKHLEKSEEKQGTIISFSSIKQKYGGFIDVMDKYLTYEAINSKGRNGLATNTIGKQFKNLKVFLNWCFDKNYIEPFSLKHIITKTEEVDNIYLTEEEVIRLIELKSLSEEDDLYRDLFIIGVETGLRFSDFTRLKESYFQNDHLHIVPNKTANTSRNKKLEIPVGSRVANILKKRNGIPPSLKPEKLEDFNKTMRRLGAKAKINDQIITYKKEAGKQKEEIKKKYELISSHTCRRTFCTLKFLDGMPTNYIMTFSGHKTERSFLRYLKLEPAVVAEKSKGYFK